MATEIASAIGMSILVFRVLTVVPASHGLVIMLGSSLVPSMLNIFSFKHIGNVSKLKKKCYFVLGYILIISACLIQLLAVIAFWPLMANTTFKETYLTGQAWAIPVSILLISARWWENYVGLYTKRDARWDINLPCTSVRAGVSQREYQPLNKSRTRVSDWITEIKDSKVELHLISSMAKIIVTVIMAGVLQMDRKFADIFRFEGKCKHKLTLEDIPGMHYDWVWVYLVNTSVSLLVYLCSKNAAKVRIQRLAYALPLMLSTGTAFAVIRAGCWLWHQNNCIFSQNTSFPSYMFFNCYFMPNYTVTNILKLTSWLVVLLLSQIIITWHIWNPAPGRMPLTEK